VHARSVLGTDAVQRFVDEYYLEREYGDSDHALPDEAAEDLVRVVEALALPESSAAGRVPTQAAVTAISASGRVLVQIDTEEAEAQGIEAAIGVLERTPDDANAWLVLARAHRLQQRTRKAIAATQKALRVASRDREAWILLGDLLVEEKRYAEAVSAYTSACAIDTSDAAARLRLMAAYVSLGRMHLDNREATEARRAFKAVLSMDPWNREARQGLKQAEALVDEKTTMLVAGFFGVVVGGALTLLALGLHLYPAVLEQSRNSYTSFVVAVTFVSLATATFREGSDQDKGKAPTGAGYLIHFLVVAGMLLVLDPLVTRLIGLFSQPVGAWLWARLVVLVVAYALLPLRIKTTFEERRRRSSSR